jgi:hypothetical protein
MSRYAILHNTFVGQFYYPVGTTIADTIGNALANGNGAGSPPDVVLPALTTPAPASLLAPLDAAAAAVQGRAQVTFAQLINPGMFGLNYGFQP